MREIVILCRFFQEASWYALKLTQFRSIAMAVEILLKTQSSAVFDHSDQKSTYREVRKIAPARDIQKFEAPRWAV